MMELTGLLLQIALMTTIIEAYSNHDAITMVAYAAIASCHESVIQSWNCSMCKNGSGSVPAPPVLRETRVFKVHKNLAYVGVDDQNDRIIVSFQGTVNWEEILEDLDVQLVHAFCPECKVHQGMYNAYKELAADVIPYIYALKKENVWITGHSLGGAIGLLTSIELRQHVNVFGYTFGSPRIGNLEFVTFASNPNWYRIVNFKDPVPQLLPYPLYHNTMPEVWFYQRPVPGGLVPTVFHICNDLPEKKTCQNSVCHLPLKPCINGKWHTTYMNLEGITDPQLICNSIRDPEEKNFAIY